MDSRFRKARAASRPLAFRLPRGTSEELGVAGCPVLWDRDHGVCHTNSSGVKRLWKASEKGPIGFKTISKPSQGRVSPARGCSSSRGVRKRPEGQPASGLYHHGPIGAGLGGQGHLFRAALLENESLVPTPSMATRVIKRHEQGVCGAVRVMGMLANWRKHAPQKGHPKPGSEDCYYVGVRA